MRRPGKAGARLGWSLALPCLLLSLPLAADGLIDRSQSAGLDRAPAGRGQLVDVDGDGWLDLCLGGPRPNKPGVYKIYRNVAGPDGVRLFREITGRTGLGDPKRQHSFIVWADLDGDGDLDAISVATQTAEQHRAAPQTHAVYRNLGAGRFERRPTDGLALAAHRATHGAVIADLDRDGRLDVAFANAYDHYGKSLSAQPMRVYRGGGDGTFRQVTRAWGLVSDQPPGGPRAYRPLYGLSAADLDRDGYPELVGAAYGRQYNSVWKRTARRAHYDNIAARLNLDGDRIRHGKYPAWLQTMLRERKRKPRATEQPFRSNANSFSLVPCDFDGDGDIDLFEAAITHAWAGEASDLSTLLVNQLVPRQTLVFERMLEQLASPDPQTGLAWKPSRGLDRDHAPQAVRRWNQGDLQAHWADLDQDGRIDLLVCESDYPHSRLRIWLQQPDHTFKAAEKQLGVLWPNCPGLALGDVDRDGDIDIVATGSRTRWKQARPKASLALWENRPARAHGFLFVRLVGDAGNRNALGAVVRLKTAGGRQTRLVSGPYGHWGGQTQPGEVHFGLGPHAPQALAVRWPDGTRTSHADIPRNAWVVLRKGRAPEMMRAFDAKRWAQR